ncbi:MAG: PAS domain-containing protein [Dissulfurimicrobium sp.]|uniref:PAS domain-containing protein n=1 Tax=Dissulfurimicrobium sp. TaxID=2022436 RepID=UPI00404ABDCA
MSHSGAAFPSFWPWARRGLKQEADNICQSLSCLNDQCINDALLIVNAKCKIIYFNDAAKRVTGLKFEALMGADLKSILLGGTNNQLSCVCDDIHKGHIIRNRRVFLPGRVHTGDSDAVLMTVILFLEKV